MSLRTPDPEQQANFQAWRTKALILMPYMASSLFALRVLNTPGIGTFAVDDQMRLYVDFDAVTVAGVDFCSQALLHEVSHVLSEHATSASEMGVGPDQHDLWNVSADLSINDDLRDAGCDALFAHGALLPAMIKEPDYQTPHHYFDVLRKRREQQQTRQKPADDQPANDQQGGGTGQQGRPSQPRRGGAGQTARGENTPFKGCGSGSGGQCGDFELSETDDLGGQADPVSAQQKKIIQISTAAAIKDHQAKSRGTVPAGWSDWADKLLTPSKTPWQQVLAAHIRRAVASKAGAYDTDRSRRSRRRHRCQMHDTGGTSKGRVIYPGTYEPMPRIEVVRDTSGSMSADDLAVVTAEVEAIANKVSVRGEYLRVTDVDAAVHQSRAFTGRTSLREVTGRGGTDMCAGIEAASQRRPRPSVVVVVTDGATPWPAQRTGMPVVAAIVAAEQDATAMAEDIPGWIRTVCVGNARGRP